MRGIERIIFLAPTLLLPQGEKVSFSEEVDRWYRYRYVTAVAPGLHGNRGPPFFVIRPTRPLSLRFVRQSRSSKPREENPESSRREQASKRSIETLQWGYTLKRRTHDSSLRLVVKGWFARKTGVVGGRKRGAAVRVNLDPGRSRGMEASLSLCLA